VTPDGWVLLAARPLPVPVQSPATSHDKAKQILAQPQFRKAQPGLVAQALRAIADGIAWVIAHLAASGSGAVVAWLVLGAVVGLIAVVAVRVGRTVQRVPERPELPAAIEVRRTPGEWRSEAEAFEARGDWKEGLRCRYRGLVAELIAANLVRDLPGRTTGELRADLGSSLPDAQPDFSGAAELFERAWYGDRPTGAAESARFEQLASNVVAAAHRHRARLEALDRDGAQLVAP
jgi:hypothetical protein